MFGLFTRDNHRVKIFPSTAISAPQQNDCPLFLPFRSISAGCSSHARLP